MQQPIKPSAIFKLIARGRLLKVSLPANTELITPKNSLCGFVSGSTPKPQPNLISRVKLPLSPFIRLLSKQPFLQQSILAKDPVVCYIGSSNRVLYPLELNSQHDWVFTSCIHSYIGNQLRLESRTGLGFDGPPIPHTFVTGAGSLCLAARADPVMVDVPLNESITVQRKCLLGYTENFGNLSKTRLALTWERASNLYVKQVEEDARFSTILWENMKFGWSYLSNLANKYALMGNSRQYVEIRGPARVILASQKLADVRGLYKM